MKRKHSPMTNRAVGSTRDLSIHERESIYILTYIPKTNLSVFDMSEYRRGACMIQDMETL
jgi:hypothetical protein